MLLYIPSNSSLHFYFPSARNLEYVKYHWFLDHNSTISLLQVLLCSFLLLHNTFCHSTPQFLSTLHSLNHQSSHGSRPILHINHRYSSHLFQTLIVSLSLSQRQQTFKIQTRLQNAYQVDARDRSNCKYVLPIFSFSLKDFPKLTSCPQLLLKILETSNINADPKAIAAVWRKFPSLFTTPPLLQPTPAPRPQWLRPCYTPIYK